MDSLSLLFSLFISLPSTLQIELIIKASVSIVINRKKTDAKSKQQKHSHTETTQLHID